MSAKQPKTPWIKPVIEAVPIKSAQAGSHDTTDAKHTHKST